MSFSHILGFFFFFFLNLSNFIFDGKMFFACPVFTPGATFNVYKPPSGLASPGSEPDGWEDSAALGRGPRPPA